MGLLKDLTRQWLQTVAARFAEAETCEVGTCKAGAPAYIAPLATYSKKSHDQFPRPRRPP